MTGPYPQAEHKIPHVVPTTMEEILRVGRQHGVSPAGFCEGCKPAHGRERPHGSVDDWGGEHRDDGDPLMVGMCRAWIRCFGRTQNINSRAGSFYGFKHEVERHFGHYIGNGAFIVAAYLEGLKVKRIEAGHPNAHFNLSRRDLNDKERRLDAIPTGRRS